MAALVKIAVLAAVLGLGACASYDPYAYEQYKYTATGAVIGGLTGAVIGDQIDDDDGKYVGGAVGALVGGAIGRNADNIRSTQRYQQPPPGGYYPSGQYPAGYSYNNGTYSGSYPASTGGSAGSYPYNGGYATRPF